MTFDSRLHYRHQSINWSLCSPLLALSAASYDVFESSSVLTPFSPSRSLGAITRYRLSNALALRPTDSHFPSKSLSRLMRRVLFFLFFQILSFAGNRQDDEISKVSGGGKETRVSTGLLTPLLFRSSDWDLCLLVFPPSMSIGSANPFSTY